jgi:hypothetical protein
MNFHDAALQGISKKERVILVNWNVLSSTQQEVILAKISSLSGRPKTEITYTIKRNGLPLRECYTTGAVAAELRFLGDCHD